MSTDVVVKKLMMFESFGGGGGGGGEDGTKRRCFSSCRPSSTGRRRRIKTFPFPSSSSKECTFTNQKSRFTFEKKDEEMRSDEMIMRRSGNKRSLEETQQSGAVTDFSTKSRKTGHYYWSYLPSSKALFHNNIPIFVIVFVTMMNFARVVESVPATTVENLDSKIKMFLESHCTMQNETLEHKEFKSFMSCGPSHGAGIVKNLGQIPEYKSDDMDQWARATKREIISQCEAWPQDRTCQETTFRLIEKCFEKDQKFIFYFMFALTDIICQDDRSDLFVKFWQNGGDACLGNHIKTLKKDWSECFVKTSTVSNADVNRNLDPLMQCFRSQFDSDCLGEDADKVLTEIMTEIRKVYLETSISSRSSASLTSLHFPMIFLTTGWITFLWQKHLRQLT